MITFFFLVICSGVLVFINARYINYDQYLNEDPFYTKNKLVDKFVNSISYLGEFWKHSFDFSGKTNRREFWITQGLLVLLYIPLISISICLFLDINDVWTNYNSFELIGVLPYISVSIYGLGFVSLIPSISLQVRRLRDAAKNPWWILIIFVPYLGWIVLLVFYLSPSRKKKVPMTLQEKLDVVEDLLNKGTIDEEEYKHLRKKILTKYVD